MHATHFQAAFVSHDLTSVSLQMLEIWAVLDAEPEVNETFTVVLSNPTGGARLGDQLHTFITVLENLAPSGLFRIGPTLNRSESKNRKCAALFLAPVLSWRILLLIVCVIILWYHVMTAGKSVFHHVVKFDSSRVWRVNNR